MKFYQLDPISRLKDLRLQGVISEDHFQLLSNTLKSKQLEICDKLSENVVSGIYLPLSIVPNVKIDGINRNIPMVTEESSVVAAINHVNKLLKNNGNITTETSENIGIGQIHIPRIHDQANFNHKVIHNSDKWIDILHKTSLLSMKNRGGGIIKVEPIIKQNTGIIHFHINTCDAMGANIINQALEQIASTIEDDLNEKIALKILSNYTEHAITKARLKIKMSKENAIKIEEASNLAKIDKHRACTHNKGIMNGVDAILLATGNDWRAVSAAAHAYAAQGEYRGLSNWQYSDGSLKGELAMPVNVGICGGVTKIHPIAKFCVELLDIKSASELSGICVAIGLMQNFAALNALTSKGICKGHMSLHIKNILAELNLSKPELIILEKKMQLLLDNGNPVTLSVAQHELNIIRNKVK